MALVLLLLLLLCIASITGAREKDKPQCHVFMAPSKIHGGGFGVFAARDFDSNEVVEMAPLFLPLAHDDPVLMNTVLSDYHYGYTRGDTTMGVMVLGHAMFYNHDAEPNLMWTHTGRGEPSESDPNSVATAVFVAKRYIKKGEELFSSYGLEDGGKSWFEARRIPMAPPDSIAKSNIAPEELDQYSQQYCSKAFAGVGSSTYHNRIKRETEVYKFQTEGLPTNDAPNAVAKVSIKAGDRIELAPALVLSKARIKGTALAPLGMYWKDLDDQHHASLQELRQAGKLKVQHQSPETGWRRLDRFESFEDVVVFPAAGSIGMIERVGNDNPNCRLEIKSSGSDSEGAGLVLEVIALNDIAAGETLRLKVEAAGTIEEKLAMIENLETTGQPLSDDLKSVKADNMDAFSDTDDDELPCNIFMAPSKIHGGGYGVFAARDFEEREVVEMAPLFLPMDDQIPALLNTVLHDYHYGYTRGDESLAVVTLGMAMIFNHDKEPNLQWTSGIGRGEPSESDPDAVGTAVFLARRRISKGEELFCSYGLEDGGEAWFASRDIKLADNVADSSIPTREIKRYRQEYCSKAFAGIGSSTYNNRIKGEWDSYKIQTKNLPPADAPTAVAKVQIRAGERIEAAPALVLPGELVTGTALAPLSFDWKDLNELHRAALKMQRAAGKLSVQHQSPETGWQQVDRFDSFDNLVIFPASGNIGMIDRVGREDPNCRMDIKPSGSESEGAGLVLEIVALHDIAAGNSLRLNISSTGTIEEKLALIEILETTGQPLSESLRLVREENRGDEL